MSPALEQLRQFQLSLYEKAFAEANAIVAGTSRSILAYSQKFEQSLPSRFTRSTQSELIDAVKANQFVIYGDFHTLRQSQRGLLRFLRSYSERQKTNKIVLALEMFKAIDQDFLDSYVSGRIPEDEFLETVNYAREWGFPWSNFKMILDFAKARDIPVIGVNTDNAGRDSLKVRDQFAAKRLADYAEKHPRHKIVCLIGEYHLADAHLPLCLSRELKRRGIVPRVARILNNVDRYYFALPKESSRETTEFLKLKKDFFCIMNSPPWMKWKSFSMWEEMRAAGMSTFADSEGDANEDFDFHTEESFDVDFQFLNFVHSIASFLELKTDKLDLENFHVQYAPDGNFFEDGLEEVSEHDASRMAERALIDGVYFHSRSYRVLLAYISINNLAESAGQFLHAVLTGFDDQAEGAAGEQFYRRIIKSAVGMLASKILNPRRKCLELHHHRQQLRRYEEKVGGDSVSMTRAEASAAILKLDRWLQTRPFGQTGYRQPSRPLLKLDYELNYGISREFGQLLGYNLYKKLMADRISADTLRRIFKKKLNDTESVWDAVHFLHQLVHS